ncbi:MAG: hypothetical protein AAFU79_04580 [Myxococcota bacterium]
MSIELTGMDGSDPLGFFAALGVLRALDDRAPDGRPRLSWRESASGWRPSIHGADSVDMIAEAVMSDLPSWADEPALAMAYTKAGEQVAPGGAGAIRDLKPPPELQRRAFEAAARDAAEGNSRSARTWAAFGTDVATDNAGKIKPTSLHFTAGQQQFLKMVRELREGLQQEDVLEALVGPWTNESRLPSLSWSGTGQRMYALRATDPSTDKRGSTPGAEWLAFLGLSFLPTVPSTGGRGPLVLTTGVAGAWKSSTFTWPLWGPPCVASVVESLVSLRGLCRAESLAGYERRGRGILQIYRARILRSEQGGYGSFAPAEVV